MEQYSKEYKIDFLYRDFRIGFWKGHQKAHDLGLYMQSIVVAYLVVRRK